MNQINPNRFSLYARNEPQRGPHSPDVRLGVVMLCNDNLPLAGRMARIWADGGARVAVHIDRKAPPAAVAEMYAALAGTGAVFAPRRSCSWGTFSLVGATLDAVQALFEAYPDLTHVMLVSGACLPLRSIEELRLFLDRNPGRDFIESVNIRDVSWAIGGLNEERFTLRFPFSFRSHRKLFDRAVRFQRWLGVKRLIPAGIRPHIGSQWWCLTADTLRKIVYDPRRPEFDSYFRHVWIPDESYFQTLARRHSRLVESRSLTLAKFDPQGKPYTFYDDHLALLANSRAFVARKIWSGATALYEAFPVRAAADSLHDEPDTARLEALLDRAAQRRQKGRPGVYMQSRFPRKDGENGKTSQPYAVIYGLSDVFPGLRGWLSATTRRSIHGHLLGPGEIDFAEGGATGPGALSSNPAMRDIDPRGFLAALIRSSPTTPGFLFSAGDRQQLNWFIATDPNAQVFMVTGAWIAPLMASGLPFDDIRQMAARLQRTENKLIEVFESVWVRARVHRCTLADLVSEPDTMLADLCRTLRSDLRESLPALPPMRNLSGVDDLLRDLQNAGLKPAGIGDRRLLRALTAGDPGHPVANTAFLA